MKVIGYSVCQRSIWAFCICAAGYLSPALSQSSLKAIAVSTGHTTGHIMSLHVTNHGETTASVLSQTFFIPSDGQYQSYVGRIPEGITIPPGETVTIPVNGYCTDVQKPPVPQDESRPDIGEWIPIVHAEPPDPLNPWPPGSTVLLPQNPLPPFEPASIPEITDSPGFKPVTSGQAPITWPGTDVPVDGTIDPGKNPDVFAPVIVAAVEAIEDAADVVLNDPSVITPFSNNPMREYEAVIQQLIWIYSTAITGGSYGKEDFRQTVYDQFASVNVTPVTSLPVGEKEQIDTGVEQFWLTFEAVGVEAKVLNAGAQTERSLPIGETTAPVQSEQQKKRCLRHSENPEITGRGGFDLIGDLYSRGRIPEDFVDVIRNGRIAQKVDHARSMHQSLRTTLTGEFNHFPCDNSMAHREGPQSFPEFPWDDFFLTVDFCADNTGKDRLIDFLDPNADIDALNAWMRDLDHSVNNLGLWQSGDGSYLAGFQNNISRALEGIADAHTTFEDEMFVAMSLRFNRSRAESRFWSAVVTIAAAAATAGIAGAAGGAMAALASAFVSGSGFVFDQGMQALGMDPRLSGLITALMTMSGGMNGLIAELPGAMIEAGGAAMSQEHVEGYVMATLMLDDDTWNALIAELDDDYNPDAIARFNQIREKMRAEIERHVKELCKVYRSLEVLLPALEKAHQDAEKFVHSSYWRSLWRDALQKDELNECCCEWSDGTQDPCRTTIPDLGHR